MKDKVDDQIDSYFNVIHNVIIEQGRINNERAIEKKVCSEDVADKLLLLLKVPNTIDVISKDNIVYKEVFKAFIYEYPDLIKKLHDDLVASLDMVEKILGPLEKATHYEPMNESMNVDRTEDVTSESLVKLDHIKDDKEKLKYLYTLIKNYCSIIRISGRKIDSFLNLDISATFKRLVQLRRAIILGGSDVYAQRLESMFNEDIDAIKEFDQKLSSEEKETLDDDFKIGKLTMKEYMKRYKIVDNYNY